MRKHILYILLPLTLMMTACATKDDHNPSFPSENDSPNGPTSLTAEDKESHLYRDTITPPNNPLVPPTENTYTVQGTLAGGRTAWYACRPTLRTLNSETFYYLCKENHFAYFNDPLLEGLYVGDTISVTGNPMRDGQYYLIEMTEVHLVSPNRNRKEEQP